MSTLTHTPATDSRLDENALDPDKKIVFLDIDGVMNSEQSAKQFHTFHRAAPTAVEALNHILSEKGVKLVISSTWRTIHTLDYITGWLEGQGVKRHRVIGNTAELTWGPKGRIQEILHWRAKYMPRAPFVILDDDFDMSPHATRFIRTSMGTGLTMQDAKLALQVLNGT